MADDATKAKGAAAKAEKDARLAEALRANLRRRKSQAAARRDDSEAPTPPVPDEKDSPT